MTDRSAVNVEVRESGVAFLTLDAPGRTHNVLDEAILTAFSDAVVATSERVGVRAIVVISGKKTGFCAGADVNRIAGVHEREEGVRLATFGQAVYAKLERCRVPVVAAVAGPCLGGGLEMVLACTGILVSDEPRTELGLPEVLLGIVPGFGGTQRLSRRIGVIDALEMILTGKRVRAKAARRSGLVDDVVCPFKLAAEAERYALELADGGAPRNARARRGFKRWISRIGIVRRFVLEQARKRTLAKTRGLYPAPLRAIELVDRAFDLDRTLGYRGEAEAIGELLARPEAHALVGLFLQMEEAKKNAGDARGLHAGDRVGVIGGGVMGAGIARQALARGAQVRLVDVDPNSLRAGMERIAKAFLDDAKRGRRGAVETRNALDRASLSTTLDGFEGCRLLIEAIVERLDAKRALFARLAAVAPRDAILCTNTSSLAVGEVAGDSLPAGAVIGLHFFNPVDRMPLVEVVAPDHADAGRVREAIAIARDLGKTPIVVKDRPGFLVNRLLAPYLAEALLLLEEGLAPESIDEPMLDLGFAMGPLAVLDTVGLDVATAAASSLEKFLGDRIGKPAIGRILAADGKLGEKSGGGIRIRERKKRVAAPWLDGALERARAERGIVREAIPIEAARDRMFWILLNEAAFALEEGVVASAAELDCAMVLGAGFPAVLGGPIAELRRRGSGAATERLEDLRSRFGVRFSAAPSLREGTFPGGPESSGDRPAPAPP
jgi:3-hydroxyacyl-CoA dehydrogenase/enoyl-CoA hydratase/3-hydroxybutyryl-CoA epimerase